MGTKLIMLNQLHSIIDQLLERSDRLFCRQVLFLSGAEMDLWASLQPWVRCLTSSKNIPPEVLITGNLPDEMAFGVHRNIRRPDHVLGQQCKVAIHNAHTGLYPDTLAALSGTVRGGGLLIILSPPFNEWPHFLDDYSKQRTPFNMHNQGSPKLLHKLLHSGQSHFGIHFYSVAGKDGGLSRTQFSSEYTSNSTHPSFVEPQAPTSAFTSKVIDPTTGFSHEQRTVFDAIIHHPIETCHVLTADRGRGKSFLLGMMAYAFVQMGRTVYLTAPHKRATTSVYDGFNFAQTQKLKLSASEPTAQNPNQDGMTFIPPEDVLNVVRAEDILLVDEAASIPIPLLIKWAEKSAHSVMATTTHGYEGTGKGFQLRFFKYLNQNIKDWHLYKLHTPIRYAYNDPLESWLFDALCLNADGPNYSDNDDHYECIPANLDEVTFRKVEQSELITNPVLLSSVFGLLIQAHYQTKPSDLRDLLDAPGLHLFILERPALLQSSLNDQPSNDSQVLCACITTDEGLLPETLHEAILNGYRRPTGHLIPQAMAFYMGLEQALHMKMARIIRIASQPNDQRSGLGSKLLKHVEEWHRDQHYDALGSSFAATPDVLGFWSKNGFVTIRQGSKQDHASGTYSALVFKGLRHDAIALQATASTLFRRLTSDIAPSPYGNWAGKQADNLLNDQTNMQNLHTSHPSQVDDASLSNIEVNARSSDKALSSANLMIEEKKILLSVVEHHGCWDTAKTLLLKTGLSTFERVKTMKKADNGIKKSILEWLNED